MKKKILIPAVVVILLAAGILISQHNRPKVAILMYHNLCETEKGVNSLTVTASKFEEDMKYLSENGYTSVLPRDMDTITDPDKTVIITFDDGYKSNYELAFPILQKYNMKAEISVLTSIVDQSEAYINFCSWDMLREMSNSGIVEIGSHSDNLHNPDNQGNPYDKELNGMKRVSLKEAEEDLRLSQEKLTKELGIEPITFAFPYGEFNKKLSKMAGGMFPVTLTIINKKASLGHGSFELPRLKVEQNTDLKELLK